MSDVYLIGIDCWDLTTHACRLFLYQMLGNMGGFVLKGIEGHVGSGMPWPVQNGT
jgi:hypothetical protein